MAEKSSEKARVFHRRKSVPNVHRALKPSKDKNANPASQANHSKPEQTDEMLGHELATDEKTPYEQICSLFAASTGPVPMDEVMTHFSNNLKKSKTLLTMTDMLYAIEEPLTPFTLETLPRPAHEPFALLSAEDLESMASDIKSSPTLGTFLKMYSIPEYTAIHFRTSKPSALNVRPRKTSVRSVSHSNLNKMKIKIPDNPLGNEEEPHKNSARDRVDRQVSDKESKDKEKSPRRLEKQTSGDRDHRDHKRASEGHLATRAETSNNTSDNRQSDSRPTTGRLGLSASNRTFHSRGKEEKRAVKSPGECTSDDGKEHGEEAQASDRSEKEREKSERAREREERKESEMLNRLASPRKTTSEAQLDKDDLLDSAQRQSRSRIKDREHARKANHGADDEIEIDKLSVPRRDDKRDEKALSSKGWSFLKKGKDIAVGVEETKLTVAPNAVKKMIQKEKEPKDSREASLAGSLPSKEASQAEIKMPDVPDRSLLHEELLAATARLLTPRFIKEIQTNRGEDEKSLAGTSASTAVAHEDSMDAKALAGKSEASDSKSTSQHVFSFIPEEPSLAVLGLDSSLAYYLFSLKDLRIPTISGAFLLQFSLHNLADGRKVSEDFNVVWHVDGPAVHPELAALSCAFQTADGSAKLYIIARVITPLSMEPETKEDKKTKSAINKKARRQSAASVDLTNETNSEYSYFSMWGYHKLQAIGRTAMDEDPFYFTLQNKPSNKANSIEDLYEIILEHEEGQTKKVSDGHILCQINRMNNLQSRKLLLAPVINTSLKFCKSSQAHVQMTNNKSNVVMLLQDFSFSNSMHMEYHNNLFIYPLKLNVKFKAPVQICVQLKEPGSHSILESLQRREVDIVRSRPFYDKNLKMRKFTSFGHSAFSGAPKPVFQDEIKLIMPVSTIAAYLVFSVKMEDKGGRTVLIGTGQLAVGEGREGADCEIPIVLDSSLDRKSADISDKKKIILTCRLKYCSTIQPQDSHIVNFMQRKKHKRPTLTDSDSPHSTYMDRHLSGLLDADKNETLKYSHVLASQLLHLVCRAESVGRRQEAFLLFVNVVETFVRRYTNKATHLLFISYYLPNFPEQDSFMSPQVYNGLTQACIHFLQKTANTERFDFYAYFLLNVILRSIAIEVATFKLPSLSEEYKKRLLQLLGLLFKEPVVHDEGSPYLLSLCEFIFCLCSVLDHTFILYIVQLFVSTNSNMYHYRVRLTLLNHLTRHEAYLILNTLAPLSVHEDCASGWDLIQDMTRRHPLSSAIIRELIIILKLDTNLAYQISSFQAFKSTLALHEKDERFQSMQSRQLLCGPYFLYVLYLVDEHAVLSDCPIKLRAEVLSCFLYVLQYTSKETIQRWLLIETQRKRTEFLSLLTCSVVDFSASAHASGGAGGPSGPYLDGDVVLLLLEYLIEASGPSTDIASVASTSTSKSEEISSSKEPAHALVSSESHVAGMAHVTMETHAQALFGQLNDVLHHFFSIKPYLLTETIYKLFQLISTLLDRYPHYYYRPTNIRTEGASIHNNRVEKLVMELMHISMNTEFSKLGTGLLARLCLENYRQQGSIAAFSSYATIAVSNIIGDPNTQSSYATLHEGLQDLKGVLNNFSNQFTDPSQWLEFQKMMIQMIDNVSSIVTQNELIQQHAYDPEMTAELYHHISKSYANSVKLRLTWLHNLSAFLKLKGFPCEAAQCKVHAAALITQYLQKHRLLPASLPHYFPLMFDQIAPNLAELSAADCKAQGLDAQQASNVAHLEAELGEALELFREGTFYEACVDVYHILQVLLNASKKYSSLLSVTRKCTELVEDLATPTQQRLVSRLVPKYFRVSFYGKIPRNDSIHKGLPPVSMYIYKKPTQFSLPVMKQALEQQYTVKYGADKVVIILKDETVDESTLDQEKLYIQIIGVFPYSSDASFAGQHFGIDKFVKETAMSNSDEIEHQRKRKTIYQTKYSFPYIENRIEVIDSQVIVLTPIQNAIELITSQTAKVENELLANPPRINPLQQCLQGSVIPMVNPGPIKVCEAFLSRSAIDSKKYPTAEVLQLVTAMQEFLRKCQYAVALNRSVMEDMHIDFTAMIERSFKEMRISIGSYLEEAQKLLKDKEY